MASRILSEIDNLKSEMTAALMRLIRTPAIAPESGGEGEIKKVEKLIPLLKEVGFSEIKQYDAKDERVPAKIRPNIVACSRGKTTSERLWIITHLDVVPSGEDALWTVTKPFEPVAKDEKIYGRGSEDNMQSMVASIFALKALRNLGIKPSRSVNLCFVADEEQGSKYGIEHLIERDIFTKKDLIVVPDGGNGEGSFIEIAEKSALWFRIRTIGKQAHASRPSSGLNAHRAGMEFALTLDKLLHKKYLDRDDYFDPPESTFEPTKKERNVDAINIVPGEDVNYFDCRILPKYDLGEMWRTIETSAKDFEQKTHVKISLELLSKNIAPKPTDPDAKIVRMLESAITQVRNVKPKIGGIGGGTCAAFFRRIGIPAVVWSPVDEMAHQPNEYSKIANLVNDAKVFALLVIS